MLYKTLQEQFTGSSRWLLPYLKDENVTDILINGTKTNYVEREGKLFAIEGVFSEGELQDFVERLLLPTAKRLDIRNPTQDGTLLDGSRYHIIYTPITREPHISIRKHRKNRVFSWSSIWIDWLQEQVISKKNILICGATGSGKTTLIAHLLKGIPNNERLIILEECVEIPIDHSHVVQMETRLGEGEGVPEISLRTLVKNALRMRPDRIILGECRGAEAFDVIQALNTGHRGSIATLHASSALDSLKRLEALVALGAPNIPLMTIKNWIGSTIQVVVYLEKMGEQRVLREILSVQGLEGEHYRIHPRLLETPLVNRPNVCDFSELFKESFYERRHSP